MILIGWRPFNNKVNNGIEMNGFLSQFYDEIDICQVKLILIHVYYFPPDLGHL